MTVAFSQNTLHLGCPTTPEDAAGWLLGLIAVVCVGAGLAGLRAEWRRKISARAWAAALLGCALLPQALHRVDPIHVRQVALPACACLAIWSLRGIDSAPERTRKLMALYLVVGLGLGFWTRASYAGWSEPIPVKLASLYSGTPSRKFRSRG